MRGKSGLHPALAGLRPSEKLRQGISMFCSNARRILTVLEESGVSGNEGDDNRAGEDADCTVCGRCIAKENMFKPMEVRNKSAARSFMPKRQDC